MLKLHPDGSEEQAGEIRLSLDELAREGARRMLIAALEAEVAEYVECHTVPSGMKPITPG